MENIDDGQYVYVIDTFSKYEKDDVVDLYNINSQWWAIKRVRLDFGRPILSNIEKSSDKYLTFHLYDTIEEAQTFLHSLKRYEGARL